MSLRNIIRLQVSGAIMFGVLAFYVDGFAAKALVASVACLAAAGAWSDLALEERKVD